MLAVHQTPVQAMVIDYACALFKKLISLSYIFNNKKRIQLNGQYVDQLYLN